MTDTNKIDIESLIKAKEQLKNIKKTYGEFSFVTFHANAAIRKLADVIEAIEEEV